MSARWTKTACNQHVCFARVNATTVKPPAWFRSSSCSEAHRWWSWGVGRRAPRTPVRWRTKPGTPSLRTRRILRAVKRNIKMNIEDVVSHVLFWWNLNLFSEEITTLYLFERFEKVVSEYPLKKRESLQIFRIESAFYKTLGLFLNKGEVITFFLSQIISVGTSIYLCLSFWVYRKHYVLSLMIAKGFKCVMQSLPRESSFRSKALT